MSKIIVLDIKRNQFLTGFKPVSETIVHLSETGGGIDKLPEGKALEVWNKVVVKSDRLPPETSDADARTKLAELVKENAKDLLVSPPTAKKEDVGRSKASKGKAASEKGGAKAGGEGKKRGKAPSIPDDAKIKVLAKEGSPFRKGSGWDQEYQIVLNSATMGDARAAAKKAGLGGCRGVVLKAIEQGFIKVA